MTTYIAQIKNPKTPYPSHTNKKFLTVKEYIDIAKKVVVHYLGMKNPLTKEILLSEDVLSNIATSMMMSDWKYEDTHNNAIESYRYRGAVTAILNYIKYKKHMKKNMSLNFCINETELYSEVANIKDKRPDTILVKQEEDRDIHKFIFESNDILNDRERDIIYMYFYENETYQKISEKYSISKERVRQIINLSLSKMKELLHV